VSRQSGPAATASRVYAALLRRYPRAHRRAFGAQMLRTFQDQYDDASPKCRRSRRTRDGAFAGVLAATIDSLLFAASLVITMALFWSTVRYNAFQDPAMISDWQHSGARTFDQFLWGDNLGRRGSSRSSP
jgi:hypothetical protein